MALREREKTLEHIVRLKRAEGQLSSSDVTAVREDLEAQLRGTVPRSWAARLLGVSHTALDKWIGSGDIPVVITKEGRKEVPIPPLLDLLQQVEEHRKQGGQRLHALGPAIAENRSRAARISPVPSILEGGGIAEPHRTAELRSLAYHRAVAPRLRPPMVESARRKVDRWREEGKLDRRHAEAWEEVLDSPLTEIREAIVRDDAQGRDLRQNSPLAGLLSDQERRRVLELA
ncbi:MAG TPA: hypothetical protein VFJ61_13865 [Solirubrobacterales bacterium]|nr:hypothetical protein [Solirubrobacterales bacterium]